MTSNPDAVLWADPARAAAFQTWLQPLAQAHGLRPETLRAASADASFRRYLRLDARAGFSLIVMDAPPELENCQPFVDVARLMRAAGLRVPEVLAWEPPLGFMLLSDLGQQTLLDAIDPLRPQAHHGHYMAALDSLLSWQLASQPGVLAPFDAALLRRELQLFPDWYLQQHRQVKLQGAQAHTLHQAFDRIVARCLAAPSVYVHRDFMPRNLMLPLTGAASEPAAPVQPLGACRTLGVDSEKRPQRGQFLPDLQTNSSAIGQKDGGKWTAAVDLQPTLPKSDRLLGVLDFQDAVYGPITYDIASLMRDAFLSWEEEFVIDVTVRYWEKARQVGLMDFEDWHSDFAAFYRAVEWMGLQRHLKVAGIFARLTLRDGKPKYLADAPRFIHYIRHTAHRYRELGPLLKLIDQVEGFEAASGYAFGRV